MRRIYFHYETGYAGEDGNDVLEFDDGVTDDMLNEEAWLGAVANAEMYGRYIGDIDDDTEDEYTSDQVSGDWEDYDPEKHGDLKPGGGKWFEDA